jgi:hypothetical protein
MIRTRSGALAPTAGQYVAVGWSWTRVAVAPDGCQRIAGVVLAEDKRQQFVQLVHSDMRVSHDRLTSLSLQQIPTHNGR